MKVRKIAIENMSRFAFWNRFYFQTDQVEREKMTHKIVHDNFNRPECKYRDR